LKHGEFLQARYAQREAVFRVTWVGLPGSPSEGHVGVECLSPESELWDVDFSSHTDDEPLLQEIVIARAVQRKLFPREKPKLHTLDYSGKCIQARTVGGDYYDFLDMGAGRVGFVLADVAGKGVAAALLMANLQGSIHSRAGVDASGLRGLLSAVNLHLFEHTEADRYATLFFGCYHDTDRTLSYVNCGHTPPLLLRREGNAERLEATATVLGLFGSWDCSVGKTRMQSGDVLSIFTDGITETVAVNGDEFGEKRLLQVLQQNRHHETIEIIRGVERALEEFRASPSPQDDSTLVVARVR
jgi:serine phosphatase RsbU (regulator of sigma subunit)